MEVMDHKCPACGAKLPFNPDTQKWKCEYCGNSFSIDELEKYQEYENVVEDEIEVDVYECSNCGAQVITDENTVATACVYCGNTAIMKNRIKGKFKPTKIIPFKTNKEAAIAAFKKIKRGKIFAPKDFNNEENIQKMSGIYIPFWVYDCDTYIKAKYNCAKIKSWRRGNYVYTKTDTYLVEREGSMFFDKVPVDGSEKFADDLMDSIEPFDYKDLVEFNPSYLSGFLAEKYDVEREKAALRAKKRVESSSENKMLETIGKYTVTRLANKNVDINFKDIQYILLPVWMLTIKYKEKLYTFAMNGQTGKMVGKIPISSGQVYKWLCISFIISFIVWFIIINNL